MLRQRFLQFIAVTILCCILAGCQDNDGPNNDDKNGYGSIMGVITDFATGEPVPNANVQLRPGGETTLTGYDGRYEFLNVVAGNYSITVSKAEYSDLIDNYVIEVRNGQRVRRDVQIKKLPTSLQIADLKGNPLSMLDYGSDESIITKSFNIFNNGTIPVKCQLIYSCNWISSVSSIPASISPGQTITVVVAINRALMPKGESSSILTISTNNGSAEIMIKASNSSGNPPEVRMLALNTNDISTNSALLQGYIQDAKGSPIIDCGFCYNTTSSPGLDDNVARLGAHNSSFSHTITNLRPGTTYHCRAFATTSLGTGYSADVSFTTASGLPLCGATTITCLDPATAKAESNTTSINNCRITEKGFCWSTRKNPSISDYRVDAGFGEGKISAYLSSLQSATTYWVRSFAKNENGIAYGPVKEFTTLSGLAKVQTTPPTLHGDEIITGGNVTDNSGSAIYYCGVCYGKSPKPDVSDDFEHTYDGDGIGRFVSIIPKPSFNGYLYIRAYVTTRYGTSYGDEVTIYIR